MKAESGDSCKSVSSRYIVSFVVCVCSGHLLPLTSVSQENYTPGSSAEGNVFLLLEVNSSNPMFFFPQHVLFSTVFFLNN